MNSDDKVTALKLRLEMGGTLQPSEVSWLFSVFAATRKDRDYWCDAHEGLAHHYAALRGRVEDVAKGLRMLAATVDPSVMGTLHGAYKAIARDIDCAVAGRDLDFDASSNNS